MRVASRRVRLTECVTAVLGLSRHAPPRCPASSSMARRRWQRAEFPLAATEDRDGGGEVGGAEVRPHDRYEQQLGVRALPEQEVAQALLAARADQQIHVGRVVAVGL